MNAATDDLVEQLLGGDDDLPELASATPADVARAKANDLGEPGLLLAFTDEEARAAGAFIEPALTAADALASARGEEA
jgi:hypothetical protein